MPVSHGSDIGTFRHRRARHARGIVIDAESVEGRLLGMAKSKAGPQPIHVVSNGKGWAVVKPNARRALRIRPTRHEAVQFAKDNAAKGGDMVIFVHDRSGLVETRIPATAAARLCPRPKRKTTAKVSS
ncbi:DUF2188 domain-containing protein [Haloferula sp. A504]|uniref:DUF2188 domain-containing protein n=1 Tax=Haloferula sp. A504 TaxID=3373601 RepID=UPI003788610D